VYSDLSGDKNGAFREYIETGDSTGIKLMLNDTVEAFHTMVDQFREIKDRKITLRGGMFGADEAKRRGLADMVGPESLAIKRLKKYI
jgi:ClpP class serine protease